MENKNEDPTAGSIVSMDNLNQVANWFGVAVISAFLSSLERFSCVHVATEDDEFDDEEGSCRPPPTLITATMFDSGVPEQNLRGHLGSFGVTDNLALQPIYTSSGGQKSRVAFAKITFNKPHIILLDEPSNHLDLDAVEALIQGLVLFQGGILMVSHDEHLISGSVDELWVVSEGRVTPFHGTFNYYKKILQSSQSK